jgi:predicted nucleic acid-binding protein
VSLPLFLDTSGWFAAISRKEASHARARAAYAEQVHRAGLLVTTSLVVAEMHVLLVRFRGPAVALEFLDRLSVEPSHEIVDVDRDLRHAAIERWLRRFEDQGFSLTDAVSFEVMRQRKIRRALALDQHFKVAGYEI